MNGAFFHAKILALVGAVTLVTVWGLVFAVTSPAQAELVIATP